MIVHMVTFITVRVILCIYLILLDLLTSHKLNVLSGEETSRNGGCEVYTAQHGLLGEATALLLP